MALFPAILTRKRACDIAVVAMLRGLEGAVKVGDAVGEGVGDVVGAGDVGGMGTIVGACHLLPPLPLQGDRVEVGDKVAVGAHLLPLPLPLVGDAEEVGDAVGGSTFFS